MNSPFQNKYNSAQPVLQVDGQGYPLSPVISRAYNYSSLPAEDITLESVSIEPPMENPFFYLIPLVSGTVKVQLRGQNGDEYYIISSTEIDAYLGKIIPYGIKKIFIDDTTITSFSIAY